MRRLILFTCIAVILFSMSSRAYGSAVREETFQIEIMGGNPVEQGKWPDVAALVDESGHSFCSGVLIAPDVVMTAGHCLEFVVSQVFLDTIDLNAPGEIIGVIGQVSYPNYFSLYDIGLLFLAHESVVPPRVIAQECHANKVVEQAPVTIAGWGDLDPWGTPTSLLHSVDMVVEDPNCETDGLGCNPAVSPGGELFAGGDGLDSCPGDSGSPLFLKTDEGNFLAGIASRANPHSLEVCGDGGVYVRPDAVLDWVEEQTGLTLKGSDCGDSIPNLSPHELLSILIVEFKAYPLRRILLKKRMLRLLKAAYRILGDDDVSNDPIAVEKLEKFIVLARRKAIDELYIDQALLIIELLLAPPVDGELPDLSENLGPNPDCGLLQGFEYPGATRILVGDLTWDNGVVSGSEAWHLFSNELHIQLGGFESCRADYSISGVQTEVTQVFAVNAVKQSDSCPDELGMFPDQFTMEYDVIFNEDGTATVVEIITGGEMPGFWQLGRLVYSQEACLWF